MSSTDEVINGAKDIAHRESYNKSTPKDRGDNKEPIGAKDRGHGTDEEVEALEEIQPMSNLQEMKNEDKLLYQTVKTEYITENFGEALEYGLVDFNQGEFSELIDITSEANVESVDLIDKASKRRDEWDSQSYRIETEDEVYFLEEREVWDKIQTNKDRLNETKELLEAQRGENYETTLSEYDVSIDDLDAGYFLEN